MLVATMRALDSLPRRSAKPTRHQLGDVPRGGTVSARAHLEREPDGALVLGESKVLRRLLRGGEAARQELASCDGQLPATLARGRRENGRRRARRGSGWRARARGRRRRDEGRSRRVFSRARRRTRTGQGCEQRHPPPRSRRQGGDHCATGARTSAPRRASHVVFTVSHTPGPFSAVTLQDYWLTVRDQRRDLTGKAA